MTHAVDIVGTVFKNGSATLLARVVGADGANIVQADIDSAKYTAYLLDKSDPDVVTPVLEHIDKTVVKADLIYDTLQLDDLWGDVDDIGYNFKHVLDVSTHQIFTIAGRYYRIIFTLTPASGQVVLVRFRVHVV